MLKESSIQRGEIWEENKYDKQYYLIEPSKKKGKRKIFVLSPDTQCLNYGNLMFGCKKKINSLLRDNLSAPLIKLVKVDNLDILLQIQKNYLLGIDFNLNKSLCKNWRTIEFVFKIQKYKKPFKIICAT